MESGQVMKVEIPSSASDENVTKCQVSSGLTRQPSMPKPGSCLCSPTSHAGSFRCRLHRNSGPALHRTKSNDPPTSPPASKAPVVVGP